MNTETYLADNKFLTPSFRIELEGSDTGREVIADVLEISFTDDLENIDSFEFNLHDWDSVKLLPKYSSPWDESGTPLTLYEGGPNVPVFEPGAQVSLFMGYLENGDLPLIMDGEVVSIATSFPAGGSPVCKVRALNAFLRGLQKIRVEANFSGTPKEIVDAMATQNNVTVQWPTLDSEGAAEENVEVEGTLYDEISKRAKMYGLTMSTVSGAGGSPELLLSQASEGNQELIAEFIWGRTLISFTPALSVAGQVAKVIARGSDPAQEGEAQNISAEKTWSDINLSPAAMGPAAKTNIDDVVGGVVDVVKPDNVATVEDAEQAALARLRELAKTLITGSGSAVGLPTLRAGNLVTMSGLGARFDGIYRLTQTTHSIGSSGYTTSFQVRKEVLDG